MIYVAGKIVEVALNNNHSHTAWNITIYLFLSTHASIPRQSTFVFCETFQWRYNILTSVILVMHPAWQGEKYVTESDPQIGSKVAVVQSHPTLHVDIMLSILKCEQIRSNVDACNYRHYIWYNTTNTEMWTNKIKGRSDAITDTNMSK